MSWQVVSVSTTSINQKTKVLVWARAAGRCQYTGCNEILWRDNQTMKQMNRAYLAHIIADKPDGPRGDPILSPRLANDPNNIMLLCGTHHKLVDIDAVHDHPVEVLHEMRQAHEARIARVTGIDDGRKTDLLLYGANVGQQSSPVSRQKAELAVVHDGWFPTEHPMEIGLVNSSFHDASEEYWKIEADHLRYKFEVYIQPRLAKKEIEHLSIFGVAPQPLLILLGSLLTDLHAAEVYQLHREPPDWVWHEDVDHNGYIVEEPVVKTGDPVLNLSLSATIADERIHAVLDPNGSIWKLTIAEPHNDFLKSKNQLDAFRVTARGILNRIKAAHGENCILHVFCAVPVAIAIELGRILMPKADLTLRVYDQLKTKGGFVKAFDINSIDGGK